MNHRIIARLDIKGPNLVKGIHLEGLRVLGKPENFAKYYYENGADELMYIDSVASLYERNSLHEIITRTASQAFIPLTVGGGIRTINDIKEILRAGADKVSLNTAAIKNPELIREASLKFGSSTIVVTIEVIRSDNGKYLAYTDNGREFTGIDAIEWTKRVEELGAGEIVLTSVDREGTGKGFDLELIRTVSKHSNIPIIAHGGAGSISHIEQVIKDAAADAVAIAGMFHYDTIKYINNMDHFQFEGNIEFLKSGRAFRQLTPISIKELKTELYNRNISCRYPS